MSDMVAAGVSLAEVERQFEMDPEYVEAKQRLGPFLHIASTIIKARVDRGLTQTQLAEMSGLSQSRISLIESAIGNPRLDTLQKVADALGISLVILAREQ